IYAASFITVRGGQMFRILGRSGAIGDPDDQRILQSMRSFASLTDPRRLAVRPDQVRVAPAASTGQFQTVIESMGQQALGLVDTLRTRAVGCRGPSHETSPRTRRRRHGIHGRHGGTFSILLGPARGP